MKGAMVFLIVFVLFLSMKMVNPARTAGDVYLDAMEIQVSRLQQQVQSNHLGQCDLLATCDAADKCSRRTCWPLEGDVKRTTCQKVQNNSYCAADPATGACPSKKFDFTKPYVRIAPTTDQSAKETATTICAQRELSVVFKDICNSTSHSRAFFGSVDGTYVQFPGSDQREDECLIYDPRLRPWYRSSMSVAKAVMVLLDVGYTMGQQVSAPVKGSLFEVAKTIVQPLLNTLSPQDYVNIITFNSTNATSLWPSPVKVVLNDSGNSISPDFDGLLANLTRLTDLDLGSPQQASNISLGIAEALRNYKPGFPAAMKIIIAFTDGDVENLRNGRLISLQGQNGTKIFIFKLLPPANSGDPFLIGTPFISQLGDIGGSFNVITMDLASDPLLSILPYFSFLAGLRANISSSPDYSSIYEDFEHVVDNVFSITKPAFDGDGNLLGVVGLNIFVDELGNLTDPVYKALQSRNSSKQVDPTHVTLTAADARIQNATLGPLCPNTNVPNTNLMGLCPQTDTKSTIQDLACCDACTTPKPSNSKPRNIAIGISLSGFALATVLIILCYCGFFPCWRRPNKQALPVFPGLDDPTQSGLVDRPELRD